MRYYIYIFRCAHFHVYDSELGFLSAQVCHCVHGDAAGHELSFKTDSTRHVRWERR